MKSVKHFLDTSIARQLLAGSRPYKKYLYRQLNRESVYVSKYVQMELRRSYLCNIIDFYYVLHMPSVPTIGDAMKIWSDRFPVRELKAVLQLVGDLFTTNQLNISRVSDKNSGLRILESFIRRFALKVRKSFKEIGINMTRCARAAIDLPVVRSKMSVDDIRVFIERINDKAACRKQCSIDGFIFQRFREDMERFIRKGNGLSNPKSKENKGFTGIITELQEILHKGEEYCTCDTCAKIGDAVIVLEVPFYMRLETLDYAFEHLCPVVGKAFVRHRTQGSVIKDAGK
jgi:hypothetical protein